MVGAALLDPYCYTIFSFMFVRKQWKFDTVCVTHIISFKFTNCLFSFSGIFFCLLWFIPQTHCNTFSKAQLKS